MKKEILKGFRGLCRSVVEHFLGKEEVTSSILVIGSRKRLKVFRLETGEILHI